MDRKREDALNNNAGQRLRTFLGREATTKEIRQLRQGEQALGLEHPAFAKARRLVAEARILRETRDELLSEVREKRERAEHLRRRAERLRRAAAKNRRT